MLTNLILMNGLSFLVFFLLQFSEVKGLMTANLPWLLILFSFPHFMLTYWIWAKRIKAWRDEWQALIFPLFYSLLFFVLYFYPWGSFTVDELIRFSYGYLLYHFVQQLYGVTLWASYQYKVILSKWHKYALRSFFLSSGLYAYLDLELRGGANILFYRNISPLSLPGDLVLGSFLLLAGLFIINVLFILKGFFESKTLSSFIPLGGLLVSSLWFVPPFGHQMVLFLPVLHAFQYFPFIFMKEKERKRIHLLMIIGASLLLGWISFRVLPFATLAYLPDSISIVFPAFILTLLNNHHFIIDGRIWKLRDEKNSELFLSAKIPGKS